MIDNHSTLETTVSSTDTGINATIDLSNDETPIANLNPRGKRRLSTVRDSKRENTRSTSSATSGEKLLKNIKQEK